MLFTQLPKHNCCNIRHEYLTKYVMRKKDGLILQYDILRIYGCEGLYPTEPLTCEVICV